MNMSRAGFFSARLCRSLILISCIAAGAIASQSANAALNGEAAYSERILVPGFVTDVRGLIVSSARIRGWTLIDERPGELTFELQHANAHMAVVVKSYYSKSEFSFRKVSAATFQCEPQKPCEVNPDIVQRWLIGLRRDAGIALLRLAIQDAGGTLPAARTPVAEAE
jgi:hypothetical protein